MYVHVHVHWHMRACVFFTDSLFLPSSVCSQLYTIPPVRSGILAVEEAAKEFVVLEEQEREREEKEREERERKRRERMSTNDVGGLMEGVLACEMHFNLI